MNNEYEDTWNEGEEDTKPAESDVLKAARKKLDDDAKAFSEAFHSDDVARPTSPKVELGESASKMEPPQSSKPKQVGG